jgi:hypothetical protein
VKQIFDHSRTQWLNIELHAGAMIETVMQWRNGAARVGFMTNARPIYAPVRLHCVT